MATSLELNVADLLRRPGTRRSMVLVGNLERLAINEVAIAAGSEIAVAVEVEAIASDIVVEGTLRADWQGECRRCLEAVAGVLHTGVREIFEQVPTEGETYPISGDRIDLEPMVRDALLLGLPTTVLCDDACRGPAPERFPTEDGAELDPTPPRDPRWAALDELDLP